MKRKLRYFLSGLLCGMLFFGAASAFADTFNIQKSVQKVYINGVLTNISVYNVDGNNYFQLRDLGREIGFSVNFDSEKNAVYINSAPKSINQNEINSAVITEPNISVESKVQDIFYVSYTDEQETVSVIRNIFQEYAPSLIYLKDPQGAMSEEKLVTIIDRAADGFPHITTTEYKFRADVSAIMPEYTITTSKLYNISLTDERRERSKHLDVCESILADIIHPYMTDYEKAYAVYQYILEIAEYGENPIADSTVINSGDRYSHNADGILINGKGVCEAYADLFYYMMNLAGVKTDICVGFNKDGNGHAWNIIKIDGNWYFTDISQDDFNHTQDFFLRGSDYFDKIYRKWDKELYSFISVSDYVKREN